MTHVDFAALQSRAHAIAEEDVAHLRMQNDPEAIERMAVALEVRPDAYEEGADMALLVAAELRIQAARWKTRRDAIEALRRG